jgi:hypothetical protein
VLAQKTTDATLDLENLLSQYQKKDDAKYAAYSGRITNRHR